MTNSGSGVTLKDESPACNLDCGLPVGTISQKGPTVTEVCYRRTPMGQLLYDLAFTRLSEKYLARKHHRKIADIRRWRESPSVAALRRVNGVSRKRNRK